MHPALSTLYGLAYTAWMAERALVGASWHGSDEAVKHTAMRWAQRLCADCGVSIEAHGVGRVDWTKPVVVASNHQSLFDIPVLLTALNRPFGFLTKRELFRIPAFGEAMRRLGCVPIDRGNRRSAQASIEQAAEQVRAGSSVVVFPEGTRSSDGRLLPFKKGIFYLVQAAGVPLVPVGITGTREVLSKQGVLVRPAQVQVHVGEPLWCTGSTAEAREQLRADLREAMLQLTGQSELEGTT